MLMFQIIVDAVFADGGFYIQYDNLKGRDH